MDQKKNLEFPAVSVCNLNRMRQQDNDCKRMEMKRYISGTSLILPNRKSLFYCTKLEHYKDILLGIKNDDALKLELKYYAMDEETLFQHGHNLSNFLEKCSFDGRSCSPTYLSYFVNHRFGNCITFNERYLGKEPLRNSETGINSGLILQLNLQSCKSFSTVHTQGSNVLIHNPSETQSPEEDRFIVDPGYEAIISLRQAIIHRLPFPYKDRCVDYKARRKKIYSKQKRLHSKLHSRTQF
ncbi:acid-sensing ion channel 3 [Nephila pilipes]|uniref:Acid-sensing ion channel 3 n=1 Tax=Nephila pilipes TaxID=299642 RepID=A0A8X6MZA7_NEPPI|nr:acid-sensing ion channel 3 [Nephila pilipes]